MYAAHVLSLRQSYDGVHVLLFFFFLLTVFCVWCANALWRRRLLLLLCGATATGGVWFDWQRHYPLNDSLTNLPFVWSPRAGHVAMAQARPNGLGEALYVMVRVCCDAMHGTRRASERGGGRRRAMAGGRFFLAFILFVR